MLLITLDTTRADHLGCYGHKAALTAAIDELAALGTLFEAVRLRPSAAEPASRLAWFLATSGGRTINLSPLL